MAEFTSVVLKKDGKTDRVARSAVELVQLKHEGYAVAREASKTVAATGADVQPTRTSRKDKNDESPAADAPSA